MSAPPLRLHDLPYDVLMHSLLPLFAAHELAQLRLVNKEIKSLVDDEHIWKGMIQQDFNFPSHASSRRSGWQTLYRGLSRPTVFVWGQYSNSRLGIPPEELKDELQQFISRYGGATFPLKLPYNLQAQEAGPPVEIVAGGWSFHCLTAKGEILFHGQLDGFQYGVELSSPGCKVSPPRVLKRATKDPVKALSCGRAHGVALTAQQDILEWHNWSLAVKHERLIQLASPNATWIAQLEAGWDCTAVLLHSKDEGSVKRSEVVWWYTQSVNSDRLAQDGPDGENTTWLGVQRSVLPPLPDVSDEVAAELDEMDHKNHSLILRLAAGESWIVALTASGLLYRVELRPEHPNQRQEWILLDNFCLPSKIAQLDYFANGLGTSKGLINSNLRITHINAQFRNFAAYTPSSSTEGGIVLLGNSDSGEGSQPIIKPELQGAGVIKVSMGE
jgi:SCF-associated factor 1